MRKVHPALALAPAAVAAPGALAVCDHRTGSPALMAESLALQARLGPVFDITADCAESARAGDEDAHASRIAALIASAQNHFDRVGVRIHDLAHRSWHSDLEILIRAAGDRIAYVVAPGVPSVAGLKRVVAAVDDVARQCGVRRLIPVHVEIGDHGALCAAPEMAAHPRIDCLLFALPAYAGALAGFLDPAAIESPGEFENPIIAQAKTAIAIAAHASGKTCTHNPFRDTDPQAAGRHARNARGRFGFSRMTALEIAHIEPVVDAMRPDAAQIQRAGEGLLAAQAADWLPIRRDGQFHDRPSYRFWWILLSRAHAAGAPLPDDVRQAFFATDTDPKTRTSP